MRYCFSFLIVLLFYCRSEAFQLNGIFSDKASELTINGKIIDDHLKIPVAASLTVVVKDAHPFRLNSNAAGEFSVQIPQSSWCTIKVMADGYELEENNYDLLPTNDIVNIDIYLTPIEKLKITGMILDIKTSQPIEAEFDLYFDTDIIKEDVEITYNGGYSEVLTKYGWYLIDIFAKGYLNVTDTIWVMNLGRTVIQKDYFLTPIETGMTVRLNNVYFDFKTTRLDTDSYPELNRVVDFLKRNPSLKLEIGGHTDYEGPDDYNLILSQGRAQAVVDYLIGQGVSHSQLTAVGYGETKPIDTGETKIAKAINRRVEFTVLKSP